MEDSGPCCVVRHCGTALASSEISTSSLLGLCWQDRLSKQRRDLDLAQSQRIRGEERVLGEGMLLPSLFLLVQ